MGRIRSARLGGFREEEGTGMSSNKPWLTSAAILATLAFCIPVRAQDSGKEKTKNAALESSKRLEHAEAAASLPAVIVHDPGDLPTLDLYYGAGGKEHAPDPNGTFTFVEEDMKQTSPKFDVVDAQGEKWRVKLGQEPQAETAATRLLWAAGYFVDEDYYVAELKVEKLPKLHRGQEFVTADGTAVRGARLKRKSKDMKKLGDWSWFENPFVGTKELNGLRVMMCLVNNWDLAADNNAIYEVDGERHYLVSDVGASFGSTGSSISRSKGKLDDYAKSKFIEKTNTDTVDFVMHSKPFILTAVNVSNYRHRSRMEEVGKHIPRADAKLLGQRLAQLSESQIQDCFRAAGYPQDKIDGYTKVVKQRIAELVAL
jgi:hypothetical protein